MRVTWLAVGVEDCDYARFPSKDFQLKWLTYYLECWHRVPNNEKEVIQDPRLFSPVSEEEVDDLYVLVNKFALASHLFWILWTFLQARHSTIDFDFLT